MCPMYQEDMSNVPTMEMVPEGSYHGRITKVQTTDENGNQLTSKSKGEPVIKVSLKIQDEGPNLGRVVTDTVSMQKHALFKLKAYYEAIGYKPGPEGHDPEKLLDGEVYFNVSHGVYQGEPTVNIPPWSVKSLTEGPARRK